MAFRYDTPEITSSIESYDSTAAIVLGVILVIYLAVLAFLVVRYIFTSISLYKLSQARGVETPILAWIPVANTWLLGKIAEHADAAHGKKSKWGTTLLILSLLPVVFFILIYVVMFVSFIGTALSIGIAQNAANFGDAEAAMMAMSIFIPIFIIAFLAEMAMLANWAINSICIYKILDSCDPNNALKNLLIYYLVPFAAPFVLFTCRNKHFGIPSDFMPSKPQAIPTVTEVNSQE